MAQFSLKRFTYVISAVLFLSLTVHIECGRSGGGRTSSSSSSRSSSSHSSPSHSSSSHTSSSHSSFSHSSSPHFTSHSSPSHSFGTTSHGSSGSHSTFGGSGSSHPASFGGSYYSPPVSHYNPSVSHTGPSAPHLPGYTVTGGAGFTPHSSSGSSIGFVRPPATTGSIGFQHHNSPINSAGTSFPQQVKPIQSGPPGYTVTGGIPVSKPSGIGFEHVNQQAHSNSLNSGRPSAPPLSGGNIPHNQNPVNSAPLGYTVTGGAPLPNKPNGIGFDHINQQSHTPLNNNFKPNAPPLSGGTVPQSHYPVNNGPPGYTVTGGAPIPNRNPTTGIGFDHINHPAGPPHTMTTAKPGHAIGFDHINQAAAKPTGAIGFDNVNHNAQNINPGRPVIPSATLHTTGFGSNIPHSQPNTPINTGNRFGTGFDHVNQHGVNVNHYTPTYQPYRPQTIVQPSGYVHYQPPVQLQYSPPVTIHHTTTHIVPVYQPSVIQTYSSGGSLLSHGGSFLGGYLIGRLSSPSHSYYPYNNGYHNTHITNNYYNNDRTDNNYYNSNNNNNNPGTVSNPGTTVNSYYTVHHYHQNREQVPSKFSIPGEDLTQCQTNTTEQLCVPNTNAFCLKNGTIMCTTPSVLTTPCGGNSTDRCVYSRIDCNGSPACNATANQTYIDFYLPCISNVTYVDNKVLDSTAYNTQGSYQLCVTAIAHPKKLESPILALANLFTEFGKWHLEVLKSYNNTRPGANI